MYESLSSAHEAVVRWLGARKEAAYLVGGCVRDRLLGRVSKDLDVAVAGDAFQVGRRMADELGGAFYVLDAERAVARVLLPVGPDGAVTDVDLSRLLHDDIHSDLAGRDFTINAMALPVTAGGIGALIDPYQGCHDLRAGRLVMVTESAFRNDPIRTVRAVRFAHELRLSVEARTEGALRDAVPLLETESPERLRDEMSRILQSADSHRALLYLADLGVLPWLLRQFTGAQAPQPAEKVDMVAAWEALLADGPGGYAFEPGLFAPFQEVIGPYREAVSRELNYEVVTGRTGHVLFKWLMLLSPGAEGEAIETSLRRLRFSRVEIRRAKTVEPGVGCLAELAAQGGADPGALYRFYRLTGECGPAVVLYFLADRLLAARRGVSSALLRSSLKVAESAWEAYFGRYGQIVSPPPLISGKLLRARFGLAPGPRVGRLLEAVREAQAEGEIRTQEEAWEWVEALLGRG